MERNEENLEFLNSVKESMVIMVGKGSRMRHQRLGHLFKRMIRGENEYPSAG